MSEWLLPRLTSVSPFEGQDKALAKALKPMGLSFPGPNAVVQSKGQGSLIWTGRNQAFLTEVDPSPLAGLAALTDQSDGWCGITLAGAAAPDVLARLIPLDLRTARFPVGHAVRTALNHMNLILIRPDPQTFQMLVFRSMARTAWHELADAMQGLAARAGA